MMASAQSVAKAEREHKLTSLITFASSLTARYADDRDTALVEDVQIRLRGLPLQASSALTAKQHELDKLGTELWNLSTRLRRDSTHTNPKYKEASRHRKRLLCLLRVFAFMLLDSAAAHTKTQQPKGCIRLMKVALKAARIAIENHELGHATKVLERAAEYQAKLSESEVGRGDLEAELVDCLRLEYFAMRVMLVRTEIPDLAWRQERVDTAEHMFTKCKELFDALTPTTTENLSDLLYEIGNDALTKSKHEVAAKWLERAYDVLGRQEMGLLSPEASELRMSTMHGMVRAYMALNTSDGRDKAWQTVKLMETDYADKMVILLLKMELITAIEPVDCNELYNVLLRMIRTVVLNDNNFRTIMYHIHKIKDHSNAIACKALDDLIEIRLFREENQAWSEKVIVTRIWLATTNTTSENIVEDLQELLSLMLQNAKTPFSASATHAAQTLLWKRVETSYSKDQFGLVESWCKLCLHAIFEKAGAQNKTKIGRKLIQCALARHDHAAAREAYEKMSESGRDDPITRYMMFKVGLRSEDMNLATESLDFVCRNSSKDATLLYACVMDAQSAGNKTQAIQALEKVLSRYDYGAPTGVHLPALLRSTARLLQAELIKDGKIQASIMDQLCKVIEGASTKIKASRRKPSDSQHGFTTQELEWFCKNSYNLALKHCAEMEASCLVRLLHVCTEFVTILGKDCEPAAVGDLALRLVFCEFLAACTYTTMARMEDNVQDCLQYYLEARNHSQSFRHAASKSIEKLGGSAQADIISKHFQIVKLELEACLKLKMWDDLDDLFDQCWKYKSPDHYETLADLVLVIHSCIVKASLDERYQKKVLSVLHKIIGLTSRQPGNDIVKLSRWLRCLFNLALTHDEQTSLKCIAQAVQLATNRHGEVDRYPQTELEWLATAAFNHAVDYYLQENDAKCKDWAEQAFVIAQWIEDDGQVRSMLMEKFASLRFDG